MFAVPTCASMPRAAGLAAMPWARLLVPGWGRASSQEAAHPKARRAGHRPEARLQWAGPRRRGRRDQRAPQTLPSRRRGAWRRKTGRQTWGTPWVQPEEQQGSCRDHGSDCGPPQGEPQFLAKQRLTMQMGRTVARPPQSSHVWRMPQKPRWRKPPQVRARSRSRSRMIQRSRRSRRPSAAARRSN